MKMEKIDVEKIMEEIRKEIQEKGYREEDLDFSGIPVENGQVGAGRRFQMDELQIQFNNVVSFCSNPIYFPLKGNPIKVFFQRLVRRAFLFVIFSAFQFQNRFNSSVMNFSQQVELFIQENAGLRKQLEDQGRQLEECRLRIARLEESLKQDAADTGADR